MQIDNGNEHEQLNIYIFQHNNCHLTESDISCTLTLNECKTTFTFNKKPIIAYYLNILYPSFNTFMLLDIFTLTLITTSLFHIVLKR